MEDQQRKKRKDKVATWIVVILLLGLSAWFVKCVGGPLTVDDVSVPDVEYWP